MTQEILIATSNQGKLKEMLEVIQDLPFKFLTLNDLNLKNEVEENGKNYQENAFLKANYFFKKTNLPTIAEDSGLSVEALKDELGIHTRRWGKGEKSTDKEWLDYFLERMAKEDNRQATFFCSAVFVSKQNKASFTGQTTGTLTKKAQCALPPGIPISAIFIPNGLKKVYARLNKKEKNKVSHRGKALKKLKNFLLTSF